MSDRPASALIDNIETTRETINRLVLSQNKQEKAFRDLVMQPLHYTCAEAGFLRSVSWLYMLYYEAGKINVEFLIDRFNVYSLDPDQQQQAHYRIVRILRTALQHSLNSSETGDISTEAACERWLITHCGMSKPDQDNRWHECLHSILNEGELFVHTLLRCVQAIATDEFRDQIIADWNRRCSRFHPPHEFDRLIAIVAADLGRDYVDPLRIRNKYYDRWSKELDLLQAGFDFETEARKRVEQVLLESPVLPITGKDIMHTFGIPPGPHVGRILQHARRLYEAEPCTASELIDRLRAIEVET